MRLFHLSQATLESRRDQNQNTLTKYNNVTAAMGGAKLFNFKQILEKLDKQKQ